VATLSLLAGVPAAAGATTLFVSEHPRSPGTSCGRAGFSEVQTAIDQAESLPGVNTVELCGGIYAEQLRITHELSLVGKKGAKITLPATIANTITPCDSAIDGVVGQPDQDLVSICEAGKVDISTLTLEAKWPSATCYDSLYNTMIGGASTLEATKVVFQNAGVERISPDVGCQGGVAVQVGFSGSEGTPSLTTPALEVGHAVLLNDTIGEYQKNGVTVDGDGSSATIGPKVTITGDGPVGTGQNGIQVSRGAVATVIKDKISANECDIASVCGHETASQWEEDASGLLLYLPGARTTMEGSHLSDNNIGVEYISGQATRPATPELELLKDVISSGYASVQINQGEALMEGNSFTGALVGIDVNENAYGGGYGTAGEYAPKAYSSRDGVGGTEASVQVEPSLGSLPGELTLTNDSIIGPVKNADSQFTVFG
jgi:hypothetical protein